MNKSILYKFVVILCIKLLVFAQDLTEIAWSQRTEFIQTKNQSNKDRYNLVSNSPPFFESALKSITITECEQQSYILPSVHDVENNSYSITATQFNDESSLPSWITFDSRRFVFAPTKGLAIGESSNFDIHLRITDAVGSYSDYRLSLEAKSSSTLDLKYIQNVTLVSPQSLILSYSDILSSSSSYSLNSSILLISTGGIAVPNWMYENLTNYLLTIKTDFKIEETLKYNLKFKVVDNCGDVHYTNEFLVTVLKNTPPIVVGIVPNSTFYEGQLERIIPVPSILFSDPGDFLIIQTSICYQYEAQFIRTAYIKEGNHIKVSYPPKFHAYCRLALVASDTGNNYSFIYFDITVEDCGQAACIKCTSKKVIDCSECDDGYILNRKTGKCVPVLTIYSLGSIKLIGMLIFFLVILNLPLLQILKELNKTERSTELIISIVKMIQTILLITHFKMNTSDEWVSFTDGFHYFEFNLRFLNPIFNLRSKLYGRKGEIPNRMYALLLEDCSAVICFVNLLIVIFIFATCRMLFLLIYKFISKINNLQDLQVQEGKLKIMYNLIKNHSIFRTYVDFSIQYFMLSTFSEIFFTFNWMSPISIVIMLAMLIYKYYSIFLECRSASAKVKVKTICYETLTDIKRFVINILFFLRNQWYLLAFVPMVFQILFLVIIVLSSIKYKVERAMLIVNEAVVLSFCAMSIMFLNYSPLYVNELAARSIILTVFQWVFVLILAVEIGLITFHNVCGLIRYIKCKTKQNKVGCIEENKQNRELIKSNKTRVIKVNSIQRNSGLDKIVNFNNFEDSLHNISSNKTVKHHKNRNRKLSNLNDQEESKHQYEEAREDDIIIERIRVVEYESSSVNSKSNHSNRKPPSQDHSISRGLSHHQNKKYEIREKNVHHQIANSELDKMVREETLFPKWKPRDT